MYFKSRAEAGVQLANELMDKYRYENTAVVALSDAGIAVGYQIAVNLHAPLRRLLMETVHISDESVDYATVMPGGVVAIDPKLSESEQQYYYMEYAGWLEQELRSAMQKINRSIDLDEVSPENLRGYNVILVDDGIKTPTRLDAAMTWLKPARVDKIILACPIVSVPALDRAHVLFDELHILGVASNYLDTNHYYDANDAPDDDMARRMIAATISDWK
ncbi:MAG: phosphoribosyltransferase family protein [Candidatus Saccharibacteria bacterium]|nr:phosphoribosyltransferase family protein [Candidatus Saccharibacteria bacterium]